ncbi:hypothetical protein M426DRAFT_256594 [Hypoxylon sp. CI-4A]|nr:hypothetical protein M426DRAFT_256594 [Hypoxylon sp. CI-4A]
MDNRRDGFESDQNQYFRDSHYLRYLESLDYPSDPRDDYLPPTGSQSYPQHNFVILNMGSNDDPSTEEQYTMQRQQRPDSRPMPVGFNSIHGHNTTHTREFGRTSFRSPTTWNEFTPAYHTQEYHRRLLEYQIQNSTLSSLRDGVPGITHLPNIYLGGQIDLFRTGNTPIRDLNTSIWDGFNSQNCALHIENLPPDCTIADLLGSIKGVGKVFASNVRPPAGKYLSSAAKIVFWDRAAVDRLLALVEQGTFIVGNYAPRVKPNAHKSLPQGPSDASRVIIIYGPAAIIYKKYLAYFFGSLFQFDLESVRTLYESGLHTALEFRFASYRLQASNAAKFIDMAVRGQHIKGVNLTMGEMDLWREVQYTWGVDPCA